MNIKALFDKNKYVLSAFVLLAMLTLIYDGFYDVGIFACRVLLCIAFTLFLSPTLKNQTTIGSCVLPVFTILSLIPCHMIFLTSDVHILLSLTAFFLALFFSEKLRFLVPIFAGLCVLAQPLTLLIFVPSIVIVQLVKKQRLSAVFSIVASGAVFVLTKLLENSEFYADQFSSYYLSLHVFHLTTTHEKILVQFLIYGIPLAIIGIVYIVKAFIDGNRALSVALILATALAVFGFTLSKNTQTVVMILIPVFAIMAAVGNGKKTKKTVEDIGQFFANHTLLFILCVALIAVMPMLFGSIPTDSEFFKRSTFLIYREE